MNMGPIWITAKLAITTTVILLIIGLPLAWWLARTNSKLRSVIATFVSLPLVLPPTVLGFYLLVAMGPEGPIGKISSALGLGLFSFSFSGLVIGSVLYSLPFVISPIQNAFEGIGEEHLETAATLGASPLASFFNIAIPLARPGIITGAMLGFAHTVGEFGVVLMIGGNIPSKTRVLSVAIYDHVEALEYAEAHKLSAGMLVFSFIILWFLYRGRKKTKVML